MKLKWRSVRKCEAIKLKWRSVRKYEAIELKICMLILFNCLNKYTITLTPRTEILISDK
jgi:hypothetical protein